MRFFVFEFRFHELSALRAAVSKKPRSPPGITYWSATYYRLGPIAVKYSARPLAAWVLEPTDMTSRTDCEPQWPPACRGSRPGSTSWCRSVPRRRGCRSRRLDQWSSRISLPEGRHDRDPGPGVRLPRQMEFCEDLSNTPWHSLPEHRPIGGINRVRKVVYEVLSKKRHELNKRRC